MRPILVVTFVRHVGPGTINKSHFKIFKSAIPHSFTKTQAFVSAKGMPTMALKQRQFGPLMAIASEAFFDMSMIII